MMKKIILLALATTSIAVTAVPASAATLIWTLSGVKFDDGGTAAGTFTTDSTSGAALSYDITTTAGTALGAFHYTSANSLLYGNNIFAVNSFLVVDTPFLRYIQLAFVNPLTSAGVNALNTSPGLNSYECNNCSTLRSAVSGFATTAAVPEPATWAMMLAGFGMVGAGVRSRRKQAVRVTYA